MKRIVLSILLICNLLFAGCKKGSFVNQESGNLLYDMLAVGFKDMYIKNFSSEDVFFIKGLTLDMYKYGYNIEIIEDLKGNFTDTSLIYLGIYPKGDVIMQNESDTLIILFNETKYYSHPLKELATLKLSNGYVRGYISTKVINDSDEGIETMLWEDLQKELRELLNTNKKAKEYLENKNK